MDVDGEKGLVVIRAMSGSTSVSLATGHMSTHFGIGAFEIEDLLVGPPCPAHRYLGRSFLASGACPAPPRFNSHVMDLHQ